MELLIEQLNQLIGAYREKLRTAEDEGDKREIAGAINGVRACLALVKSQNQEKPKLYVEEKND